MLRAVLALIVALAAAATPLVAQSSTGAEDEAVLSSGDVIRITVWRRPELSGEFPVTSSGALNHPLYREVRVAGVPLPTVEERLESFLARLESNPQFSIQPLFRVAVGGEVRQPNLYSLPAETTVAQAVALAGGLTERGRLDRVRLVRNGETVVVDLTGTGAELTDATVRSGDQILVDRRTSFFREVIAPVASVTAAIASVLRLVL